MDPHLREDARVRWRARPAKRWGRGSPFPRLLALSRAVPKAQGGKQSVPSRPTCGCPAWAGTRSTLACRALPPPRAPPAAAGPSSRCEKPERRGPC